MYVLLTDDWNFAVGETAKWIKCLSACVKKAKVAYSEEHSEWSNKIRKVLNNKSWSISCCIHNMN